MNSSMENSARRNTIRSPDLFDNKVDKYADSDTDYLGAPNQIMYPIYAKFLPISEGKSTLGGPHNIRED